MLRRPDEGLSSGAMGLTQPLRDVTNVSPSWSLTYDKLLSLAVGCSVGTVGSERKKNTCGSQNDIITQHTPY